MTEEEFLSDLTAEQINAVKKIDANVSVTANAGSGKTTLLVRKYLYLQLFHPKEYNYRNVVAITFTKKAASEILNKVRHTIDELLHSGKADTSKSGKFSHISLTDEQVHILNEINRNLINLKVSTIHHFCRTIIKDFCFRLDLQPNLTLLEDAEQSVIIDKIIINVLGNPNSRIKKHIIKATQFLGIPETIAHIKSLFWKRSLLPAHMEFYSKNPDEIKSEVTNALWAMYSKRAEESLKIIADRINGLEKIKPEAIETVLKNIEDYRHSQSINNIAGNAQKLESIRTVKSGASYVSNKIFDENEKRDFENTIKGLEAYGESLDSDKGDDLLRNRVAVGLALTEIAIEVVQQYEVSNHKENRIDNDSSIDLVARLLKEDDIRKIVQSELAYLMIDEFQDTDNKQLEITNYISESGKVKLFAVGDDKQGIYGFRNADVRVFGKLRKSLPIQNQLMLTTSFRSKIEINAFVNDIFQPYMLAKNSDYDVDFQKIVSAKRDEMPEEKRVNILFFNNKVSNEAEPDKVSIDSQLLRAIHEIFETYKSGVNQGKVLKLSDICVLSSSGGNLAKAAKLLSDQGIENTILSSKGFYSKNEIKELTAFIKFINECTNDLYCAATLKSSLFNYSDNDIFKINNLARKPNNTLWERFKEYVRVSSDDYGNMVIEILEKAIHLANRLPISNILIQIIDESNWNFFFQEDSSQQIAYLNLYKFMGIARSLEDRAYGGMAHLFELLDVNIAQDKDSEEVGDASNAIQLSTIHHAKGMEYKHVILYDYNMFIGGSPGEKSIIDEVYGSYMKIPSSIDDYSQFGTTETIIDMLISEKEKIVGQAENLRKCYVATTRAIETLHILISTRNKIQLLAIGSVFNLNDSAESEEMAVKKTEIGVYNSNTKGQDTISFEYTVYKDSSTQEIDDYVFSTGLAEPAKDLSNVEIEKYLDAIDTSEKDIRFSATKLSMLDDEIEDGDKFKEIYIYGLPHNIKQSPNYYSEDEIDEPSKEVDGTEYGILFHAVMEHISDILDEDFSINYPKLNSIIDSVSATYDIFCGEATKQKLFADLELVLASKFINEHRDILLKSYKEFELKMAFGDHILQATFDSFNFDGDVAEIWDWKTNKFSSRDTLASKAQKYQLQMEMYALFAFQYDPSIKMANTKLFFVEKAKDANNSDDWIFSKTFTRDDIDEIKLKLAEKIGTIKGRYPNTYRVHQVEL